MLIDYMGRGFLDNIIALFRQDGSLYRFIPDLLGDEQMRVRLGAVALVEDLISEHREEMKMAVPGLIMLLRHGNPTIRGDAASLLGTMKARSARAALEDATGDLHPGVREAALDALRELNGPLRGE